MDGLPNFLNHGAPLARFARRSSAVIAHLAVPVTELFKYTIGEFLGFLKCQ